MEGLTDLIVAHYLVYQVVGVVWFTVLMAKGGNFFRNIKRGGWIQIPAIGLTMGILATAVLGLFAVALQIATHL